jgi:probable HAF family extracellular repeat protein
MITRFRQIRAATVASFGIVWTSTLLHAQCLRYTVDLIQPPSCGFWNPAIGAYGISELGEIAGTWSACSDVGGAYGWYGSGGIVNIPILQPYNSHFGRDINSERMIVGRMENSSHNPPDRAFLFHNSQTQNLGALSGSFLSEALGINDAMQVCGYSSLADGDRACIWVNNQIAALNLPFGPNSVAYDISPNGFVCGWMGDDPSTNSRAFTYNLNTNETIDLGHPLSGTTNAQATSVNSGGTVCGWSHGTIIRAFICNNKHSQEILTLSNYPRCLPQSINDSNTVVGFSSTSTGVSKAFVWQNGITHRLETLVHPPNPNLTIATARSINNAGQIAADGFIINSQGPATPVALRLNPIPRQAGDATCDWIVNEYDLLAVVAAWHNPGGPADLNHDNIVNVPDLLIVIANWTRR